jgi:DNA (cytosine-5)-methyltransferase 1
LLDKVGEGKTSPSIKQKMCGEDDSMLIKKRVSTVSQRGIYLQDRELNHTIFQPGQKYKYVLDVKNQQMIILHSEDEKGNIVSKRKIKEGLKPVIDIRSKEALSVFKESDYLQIEIFKEKVVVKGYSEQKDYVITNEKEQINQRISRKKVTDISEILKVKETASIVLSKDELKEAVGSTVRTQQLDIFDLIPEPKRYKERSIAHIQEHLKHIEIPLQVASVCSGAGILDLGFRDEGFQLVFALEKDKDAVKTYKHNLGDHIVEDDMTTYDLNTIPKVPIFIGGTECKGFSNSNRKTNYLDNPHNLLVKKYIEGVKASGAQIFVLENVPQILTAGGGRFKEEIYEELSDFEISSGVVSSVDMGDPQYRQRALFIGSKLGKIELPSALVSPEEYKTVREAFQGLHDGIPNQLDVSKPKLITLERMKYVPEGGNIFDIPEAIRPKGKHSDMYKRIKWDKPSVTIVNPRKAVLTHPEENRILSVRECARLFSVEDEFTFKGTLSSMQQQICNAVPLRMAKAVASVIKHAIMKYNIAHNTCSVMR